MGLVVLPLPRGDAGPRCCVTALCGGAVRWGGGPGRRGASREFAEEIGVSYPIGADNDGSVDRAYDPLGLPASYIISAEGVILERIFGQVDEAEIDAKFGQWFGG